MTEGKNKTGITLNTKVLLAMVIYFHSSKQEDVEKVEARWHTHSFKVANKPGATRTSRTLALG